MTRALFGWDQEGQLGNGAGQADQGEPSPILGLANVVDVAAGGKHSLALLSDGTLRAWGRDLEGQVGNGGANSATGPRGPRSR